LYNDFVNHKSEEYDDFKFLNMKTKTENLNDLFDRSWFQKKLKELDKSNEYSQN